MVISNRKDFQIWLRGYLKGKSVALVGSSPNVLQKEYGKLIDAHDVVVRFNNADISGLKECVGSKTDVRFVGFRVMPAHFDFLTHFLKVVRLLRLAKMQIFSVRNLIR